MSSFPDDRGVRTLARSLRMLTFDELQRGAAKEMAARQSLEDDDYLPNLKNEL